MFIILKVCLTYNYISEIMYVSKSEQRKWIGGLIGRFVTGLSHLGDQSSLPVWRYFNTTHDFFLLSAILTCLATVRGKGKTNHVAISCILIR